MLPFYLRDVGNKPVYYDWLHNENIRHVGSDSRTLNGNGWGAEGRGGSKYVILILKIAVRAFFLFIENLDVGIFFIYL